MSFPRFFRRRVRNSQGSGHASRRGVRPRLEALDQRCLLSTITVTTALDNGNNTNPTPKSLRAAIIAANNNPKITTINFNISGVPDIKLVSPLPDITANGLLIDGLSLGGAEIDGQSVAAIDGLTLKGNNCTVYGVSIINCEAAGILVEGSNDTIGTTLTLGPSTWIGTDPDGFPNLGDGVGVYVYHASGLTIQNSLIADNTADGIEDFDSGGIVIQYNNKVYANAEDGLRVLGGHENAGQTFVTSVFGNTFNQNGANGIQLVDSSNNKIDENIIGNDGIPGEPEGNSGDGIRIESSGAGSSTNNTIVGNHIASNGGNGVNLIGPGTSNNSLTNNYIGIYLEEVADEPDVPAIGGNQLDGVAISGGANHNQIGGTGLFLNGLNVNGDGNAIVANDVAGVGLSDTGTSQNAVQGNEIGIYGVFTDTGNGRGVVIADGASENEIGGLGNTAIHTGEGNLISGSTLAGVVLNGSGTSGNLLLGNYIGTDATGTVAVGNHVDGVLIDGGASDNTVGLSFGDEGRALGNLISGNGLSGVLIAQAGTSGNVVQSNEIGTTAAGTAALANLGDGVDIEAGASGNTVGGPNRPANSYLPGNVISGNHGNGVDISMSGTDGNQVEGNSIGTDVSGLLHLANSLDGVLVTQGAADNFIGGTTPAMGNVISGNTESGVVIDLLATEDAVENNEIGTIATGLAGLGNGQDGVVLQSTDNVLTKNVISGNDANGVVVNGSRNLIDSNEIGTDATGTFAVPNQQDGVFMSVTISPGQNSVGGVTQNAGNLISGNLENGIDITGPASAGNLIERNDIGTDVHGESAIGNNQDGILIENGTGYTIGGNDPGLGNLISGNVWDGIEINGSASTGILVLGNRIGTDETGMSVLGNERNGVHIDGGASFNTIGGTGVNDGNLISGNTGDGVLIQGDDDGLIQTGDNSLIGNKIGTNVLGEAPVANDGQGVQILSSNDNSVGGGVTGAGNLISGNAEDGVQIASGATATFVQGNLIGTDIAETKPLANGGSGVDILQSADDNIIGGVPTNSSTPGNVISGNQRSGVVISGTGTNQNLVEGNDIGTTLSGKAVLGNKRDGVDILNGAATNQIGGSVVAKPIGAGNIVSGNAGDGVQIAGTGTDGNLVQGNSIGTNASGQAKFGNGGDGVFVLEAASDNAIGGTGPGTGNAIAFNGLNGVMVGANTTDDSTGDAILGNSIYSNANLGIDLANESSPVQTPVGSPPSGPNNLQNAPLLAGAVNNGSSTTISGTLISTPNTTFRIEFFSNPTGTSQGETYLGFLDVTTNGSGSVTFSFSPTSPVALGLNVTATATDPFGNTSEFAQDCQVN